MELLPFPLYLNSVLIRINSKIHYLSQKGEKVHASTFFTHSGPPRAPVPVHTQTHSPVVPENTGGVSKITLSSLLRFWSPFSVKGASRNENQDIAVLISHFMLLRAGNFPNRMFVSDDRNYNLSHSNVDLNYPTKQLGSQALNLLLKSSLIDKFEVLFGQGMDIPALTHSPAPAGGCSSSSSAVEPRQGRSQHWAPSWCLQHISITQNTAQVVLIQTPVIKAATSFA